MLDVVVDGWIGHSNMSRHRALHQVLLIHTLPKMEHALEVLPENSKSKDIKIYQHVKTYLIQLTLQQSLLLLMHQIGDFMVIFIFKKLIAGGVFSDCAANLNHGVLVVGVDQNGNYKVRNSWG